MQGALTSEIPATSVMKRGSLIRCGGDITAAENDSDDSSAAFDVQLRRRMFQPLATRDDCEDDGGEEGQVLLVVVETTPPVGSNYHDHGRLDESDLLLLPPTTEQTQPETPIPSSPGPSSSDSSRGCGAVGGVKDSQHPTRMGRSRTQNSSKPKPIRHRSQSTPTTKSSPSPLLLYTNPFSCYTPSVTRRNRGRRREVMGLSFFSYGQGGHDNHENDDDDYQSESDHSYIECSDSSIKNIDNEEELEKAAKIIRMELLAAEMKELAVQAERAAEAGFDSFAAQPCVFEEAKTPSNIRSLMRRSLSAGDEVPAKPQKASRRRDASLDPLSGTTSGNKLSVVDLRDIHEVFPSFRQFHTHLRTHFHRNHVSESQSIFSETNEQQSQPTTAAVVQRNEKSWKIADEAKAFLPMCNENTATPLPPAHRKQISIQQELMKTFNLEQWVPKVKDIPNFEPSESDEKSSDDIGFFIANHIAPPHPFHRGKVEVPPDLDENVECTQFKLRPRLGGLNRFRDLHVSRWHQNPESVPATRTPATGSTAHFPDHEFHHVMSLPSKLDGIIQPRALFDAEEYDSTEEIETSHSSLNRVLIREVPLEPPVLPPPPPPPPPPSTSLSQREQHISRKPKSSSIPCQRSVAQLDDLGTSSNSILDGQGERFIFEQRLLRTTSIGENSEGTIDNPIRIPSLDYDFVTPSRLRKIREFRKSAEETLADGTTSSLLLPMNSNGEDSPIRPFRFNFQQRPQNPNIQLPVLETVLDVSDSLNISERTSNVSALVSMSAIDKDCLDISSETQTMTMTVRSDSSPRVDGELHCTVSKTDFLSLIPADLDGSEKQKSTRSVENVVLSKRPDPDGVCAHSPDNFGSALSTAKGASPDISRPHFLPHSWPPSPVSKTGDFDFSEISILEDSSRKIGNSSTSLLKENDLDQKSLLLKRNGPDNPKTMTPQINDCGCLSLSPDNSCDENETDPPKIEAPIRKSTSTGALNEFHTWNDMLGNYTPGKCRSRHDHSKSFRAAMNMLSKLSPRSKKDSFERALYVRPKENDEFLSNFLYCSRPLDGHNRHPFHDELCDGRCGTVGSTACGDVNPGYCCTNILTDALALGLAVPRKHPVTSHKLVNLSGTGIPASKIDPDSWFDMANERFDDVLDHLAGGGGRQRTSSMSHFSFQAPTLKKKCLYGKSKAVVTIMEDSKMEEETEEEGEGGDTFDEKKFDGIGLYDLDDSYTQHLPIPKSTNDGATSDSKHARHLSLMSEADPNQDPSVPHRLNSLSDKQFEVMYGITKDQIEAKTKWENSFIG